jgi:cellulose synthase operon protein C
VRDNPQSAFARRLLAFAYEKGGDPPRAEATMRAALADNPGDPAALVQLVQFLLRRGMADQANGVARDFTRRNTDSLRGWRVRATLCQGDGRNCEPIVASEIARLSGRSTPAKAKALAG